MTIQHFQLLEDAEKELMLWTDGKFLTKIEEGHCQYDMYKLYNFYVSLFYELSVNKRAVIKASIFPEQLLPHNLLNKLIKMD